MKSILLALLLLTAGCAGTAAAPDPGEPTQRAPLDRDRDNDGRWDHPRGIDRDVDGDGIWDCGRGGIDRDLDDDGKWDCRGDRPLN